ncbi:hypothetical protein NDU88_010867 [Pleurodeles waltl]|uniref:Uncharacterized protein n=1 Tax=Pleurodeles waltl TaxID=8319 RepID=A0AAV7S4H6_PLEWA|nr:hypothetical protein NDU88_010867 [Pleurodeles waltl]
MKQIRAGADKSRESGGYTDPEPAKACRLLLLEEAETVIHVCGRTPFIMLGIPGTREASAASRSPVNPPDRKHFRRLEN